jgi:hypothetical protein
MNEVQDTAAPNTWELPVEEIIKEATNQMTYDNSNKKTRKTTLIIDVNKRLLLECFFLQLSLMLRLTQDM